MLRSQTQQITGEKAAEEAEIRREFEEQMATLEAQSRAEFERDLESKIAAARAKYEAELVAGKKLSQAEIESKVSEMAISERGKFEASLVAQKAALKETYLARVKETRAKFQRQLGLRIVEAKREYAMRERRQLPPRMIRQYRETARVLFGEALLAEAEVFEEEAKAWETRVVGEFETGLEQWQKEEAVQAKKRLTEWEIKERERLEVELAASEAEIRGQLETQIKEWKEAERAEKLEPAIAEWRKAWKPKGLAEQLLEYKAPDLPKWELKLFDIPVEDKGVIRVGFDIGKFFEGIAEGSVVATAGLVASAESLVYGVGGLVGIPTPRPPPTLVGGLISAPISAALGRPKPTAQLEELAKKPYAVTYAAATLLGDVLISYGIGKAAQKLIIEPISKTAPARAVGVAFRAKAPKLALRAVYGKKGAAIIMMEREARVIEKTFGAWTPLSETIIGAERAAQEAAFGMPFFRAETLKQIMPTTEFARLRYAQWLAPRKAIEAQLAWEVGLAPAFGIQPSQAAIRLSLAEKIAQAEKIPTGKVTVWTRRAAFEFEQATKMVMPSRLYVPRTRFISTLWKKPIGIERTPFEKTLATALGLEVGRRVGGLSAAILAPEIMKQFPIAPPSPETFFKAPVRMAVREVSATITAIPAVKAIPKAALDLSAAIGLGAALLPKVTPRVAQEIKQVPAQIVGQLAKIRLKVTQISLQITGMAPPTAEEPAIPTIPTPPFPEISITPWLPRKPKERKRRLKRKKKKKDIWELRAALFEYPVRKEKEVPSFILEGLPKQTTRRKSQEMNVASVILGKK